jgi:hypothetical protein
VTAHRFLAVAAICLAACQGDSSPNPVRDAFAATPKTIDGGTAIALRYPASGSQVRLYRLPDLDEVSRQFDTRRRRTAAVIGFASEADLVLTLVAGDSEGFDLLALDLITGRSRTIDTTVAIATLGPTGNAYVVHVDGSVAELERRSVVAWPDSLVGVTHLWGAARGRVLAVTETELQGRELVLQARGQEAIRQSLPAGEVVASRWGRLVAVATDTGVALLAPHEPEEARFIATSPAPRLLEVSPSSHRIYAVLGDRDLAALGRFGEAEVTRATLPGRVAGLRVDPLGRILLARAEADDSIWILDAVSLELLSASSGSWDDDLPTVAPDGTVLMRNGTTVVALDADGTTVASRETREGESWLIAEWDPRRPALELAADSAAEGHPGQIIYVQVSSSGNPAWAEDLATELRAAGLNATVLPPDSTEERYRVVLGPYATREEAEDNGRRLGRPFWILTRDTVPTIQ